MRRVAFDPESLTDEQRDWWDRWSKRAADAKAAALKAHRDGVPFAFNQAIWSDLKEWLLTNVFFGKCAYCEGKYDAQSFGDAEHFRPKGKVTEWDAEGRASIVSRDGVEHTGYFWLAYDWQNLMPACQRCNTEGKMTLFPVGAQRAWNPDQGDESAKLNDVENPLLVSPYEMDAAQYFKFDIEGTIVGIGERGEASVKAYKLDRPSLVEERKERQERALDRLAQAFQDVLMNRNTFSEAMEGFTGEQAPYSEAVRTYVQAKANSMIAQLLGDGGGN